MPKKKILEVRVTTVDAVLEFTLEVYFTTGIQNLTNK